MFHAKETVFPTRDRQLPTQDCGSPRSPGAREKPQEQARGFLVSFSEADTCRADEASLSRAGRGVQSPRRTAFVYPCGAPSAIERSESLPAQDANPENVEYGQRLASRWEPVIGAER